MKFDVRKGEVASLSPSSSTGGAAKDSGTAATDADVIVVNVPRELRGRSEIIVYLSEKPVRGTSSQFKIVLLLCVFYLTALEISRREYC